MKTSFYRFTLICFTIIGACVPRDQNQRSMTSKSTLFAIKPRVGLAEVDSSRLLAECKGLLGLTNPTRLHSTTIDVKLEKNDSTWLLTIVPELSYKHRQHMQQLLDTLIAMPSSLPASRETRVKITETDSALLETLGLATDTTFALQPQLETAYWSYQHKEIPGYGGMSQSTVTTYLSYKLATPIPSLQYTYALAKGTADDGKGSQLQETAASMFKQMPPIPINYAITTGDKRLDSLWATLKNNHIISVDSSMFSINWSFVDFGLKPFSPILDVDTLMTVSIAKLPKAHPEIYHLLMAPELSRILESYYFN